MEKYPAPRGGPETAGRGDLRRALVDAAAHLLAEHGPQALSARKVAAEAGTSTMAVYSAFGSMENLVLAVVDEGFAMLERSFVEVAQTDDPVHDVAAQTAAYLAHATEYAELYRVMFGVVPLGRYRLPPPSIEQRGRRETLDRVAGNLARAVAAGRAREEPAAELSFRWWSLAHGYALLESSGHILPRRGRSRVLEPLLVGFFVGLGDDPARARTSVGAGLAAR